MNIKKTVSSPKLSCGFLSRFDSFNEHRESVIYFEKDHYDDFMDRIHGNIPKNRQEELAKIRSNWDKRLANIGVENNH
ncbi:hypothetical protein ACI3E1_07740 [Ligilactobacillus sp. LYQ139]|uniref:hypothetical protein n=1 Tax=Ligilactobacillus sp. LYQ139 TaxID=3378800 RepID=UPI0038536506